jgi:hypothetical protein
MDVIPHTGIGDIRLGSSRESIATMLGAAEKKSRDYHEDGEHSEVWVYRLLRLELSFDSEHDFYLSHITSYHPYTLVRSFNPIGLEEKFLLQKFPHLDLDVEVSTEEKYFTDKVLDLTFGTARGKVVSVTIFPAYDGDGKQVLWPAGPS